MKKLLTILSIFFLFSCTEYGEKLTFNGTDVYYKDGVTKEQAQTLGEYLVEEEFADGGEKSVQILKDEVTGNLTFRMVVANDINEDQDMIFKVFAQALSTDVFNGEPVDFHICDNTFETIRAFSFSDIDKIVSIDGTSVAYTKNVTKNDAQKLADYLKESEFTDGTPKTIQLDKDGDTFLFRMVVKKGVEENEDNVLTLKMYGMSISLNAFDGKPVLVHLCDDALNTLRILK